MAAKVDDNAEPRRRIPNHPPYSLMIGEAIRSLNEEQGSTESSISEYIKANFDGLPWGHDRLLPYYLNKLAAQGEFVNDATNRYLLADDDDDDCYVKEEKIVTLPPMNAKGWGKFARKKRFKDDVGTNPLQSVTSRSTHIKDGYMDEDGGVPLATLFGPQNKDGNLDKDERATVEIKDGNFDEDGVPLACEGDLVIEVHPCKSDAENSKVAANNNAEMISESLPKRCGKDRGLAQSNMAKNFKFDALASKSVIHKSRGRPPKVKDAKGMKLVNSYSLGNNANVIEPENIEDRGATKMAQNQEDDSEQVPKKLGRPRKRKLLVLEDSSEDSMAHVEDVDTLQSVDASSLCANDDNAIEPQVIEDHGSKHAPKKLGRPRKQKHQALEGSSKEVIVHVEGADTLPLVNLSSPCTKEDTRNCDDGSKSVSKGHGMPLKKKSKDIEMVQGTNIYEMKNPTEIQTNEKDGSKSLSKKLGRPLKLKKSSSQNGDHVDLLECDPKYNVELQEGKEESDLMSKYRGKTNTKKLGFVAKKDESNLPTETSGKSEEKNSTWVPKRRGRPPKPKLDLKVDVP